MIVIGTGMVLTGSWNYALGTEALGLALFSGSLISGAISKTLHARRVRKSSNN
jgi:hypothetical protein